MNALAQWAFGLLNRRAGPDDAHRAERDNVDPPTREMRGFFDSLTPDQQRQALAYRGPETHGPDARAAKGTN
jgi:hypothetical protein